VPTDQPRHPRRSRAGGNIAELDARQFQVIHDTDGGAGVVDQLSVQSMQAGIEEPPARRCCVGKGIA
jgi:hypothetical protein